MKEYDQSRVIEFLGRADSYGDGRASVKKIETHISVVFLVGSQVFKLKRAVKYPYLDFSTLQLRHQMCEAEVSVNRRTAPDLYKGVVAVTLDASDALAIGGDGEVVEWLVEMNRFDEDTLFDRLELTPELMDALAGSIAGLHMTAEVRPGFDSYQGLEETITGNAASFSLFGASVFDAADIDTLTQAQLTVLRGRIGKKLKQRARAGRVRHCHGDLHLRNICLIDGQPTLFDAIEFNDSFACIDVIYDLAFLLMDIDFRAQRDLANIVLNRYLDITGDTDGLQCLPLLLSVRAAIRAHVSATAAAKQSHSLDAERLTQEARAYLDLARTYLKGGKSRLLAVGGLSGSGKSLLARELAPHVGLAPGARIVRSDIIRKHLAGVDPLSRLDEEGYSSAMTQRTYKTLYEQARRALQGGHCVIVDAVFAKPEERETIAALATEMGVEFDGLWLQAPAKIMAARVTQRTLDASDADAAVVRQQLSYNLGEIDWLRIDSAGAKTTMLRKALKALGLSVVSKV
jgi:hypothetical protein